MKPSTPNATVVIPPCGALTGKIVRPGKDASFLYWT